MGLIKTAAKVAVASSVHGRVKRRQQQRWANQDAQAAQAPAPAAAPPAPAPAADPIAVQLNHLAQLGALRDAGILTEDEFQAKKTALLNS
jgi:hypothetical protein